MRNNVTTPGGFFVGLGGIVAFCVVSSVVYLLVKIPGKNTELRPQQVALGLIPAPDVLDEKVIEKKKEETDALLKAAADKYNGGVTPDLDRLPELRGVVRYREAQKAAATSQAALEAPSNVAGKTVIAAAMEATADEIKAKKPAASKVSLDIIPADPKAAPTLPNVGGGGVHTVQFANPAAPAAPSSQPTPNATK